MATVNTFNTLGFARYLTDNGFEKKQAEALAEAYYEFQVNDLATKEFVRTEIVSLENRLNRTNAKMLAFAVGALLAGLPIVISIVQRLG